MSVIIQGYQLREIAFGEQVITEDLTLPQTGTADLFTVSGGLVLLTSLIGVVTTVIASSDPELTLGLHPSAGTAETAGLATSEALTSAEVGSLIGLSDTSVVSGDPDVFTVGPLQVGVHAGNGLSLIKPMVIPSGFITWTTGANKTGAIKWYLTYVPLDTGASVAAS
jgi:hypothetical protein